MAIPEIACVSKIPIGLWISLCAIQINKTVSVHSTSIFTCVNTFLYKHYTVALFRCCGKCVKTWWGHTATSQEAPLPYATCVQHIFHSIYTRCDSASAYPSYA